MSRSPVAALVGPTAVGKTELSLDLARRLDAEIVSVDSMQVYVGMDIGTAKVSVRERSTIPHHLIDIRPPEYDLTVAEFQSLARDAIADVTARGKLPLLVGGSGLYLRAVVDDLEFPARSEEVRAQLEVEVEELGAGALHERLKEVDPVAAARIEPGNARRTVRALEVIELTGRLFSDNRSWERYNSIYELRLAGLTRDRDELYARVEARVDSMIEAGLVAEVEMLRPSLSRTARQALGYRQVLESPAETLRDDIVRATKRFARRQESWFRADPRVRWFDAAAPNLSEEIAGYLGN